MRPSAVTALLVALVCVPTQHLRAATNPKPTSRAALPTNPAVAESIPDLLADGCAVAADRCWHQGDYVGVAFFNAMVVALDPSDVDAWSNYAWITWAGLYKDAEALSILRRGVRANPNRYELYAELGAELQRQKRYKESEETFAKALRFSPPPLVWNQYAHAIEKGGDPERAASVWREMLRRFPDWPLSQVNLDRLRRHGLIRESTPTTSG
jgi:tetratricopeptide (TPR) repeat protein